MAVPVDEVRAQRRRSRPVAARLNQLSALLKQMNQRRVADRLGDAAKWPEKRRTGRRNKTSPPHGSSSMINAVKLDTMVSACRHACLGKSALRQVCCKKVSISQPCSTAT